MKTILIAVPTAKYIETDTFASIYNLIIPEGYRATFQTFFGYNIAQIRNLIASHAINYDYLLSVDSDMGFHPESLIRLLAADKDIIGSVYRQRLEPEKLEVYGFNLLRVAYKDIYNSGPREVGAVGMGLTLIKSKVLKEIGYPQFEYHSALDHNDTFSEDLDFCLKAKNKGFEVWVESNIVCHHFGATSWVPRTPTRLELLGNQRLLPEDHINFLRNMTINPKVIYDIGACVLHWTNEAQTIWPNADIILFEAMKEAEPLYAGRKYHLGILSDYDGRLVDFYCNTDHPGGNTYYEENASLSPLAKDLFPKSSKEIALSLATVCRANNFPIPDLIKMDVQGAELDIIKGGLDIVLECDNLILELQHKDYNKGAPKDTDIIQYLQGAGYTHAGMFCGSALGVDGDHYFYK